MEIQLPVENSSSRGGSPTRSATAVSFPHNASNNNGKKATDTLNSVKSSSRKSPQLARRMDNKDKSGTSGSTASTLAVPGPTLPNSPSLGISNEEISQSAASANLATDPGSSLGRAASGLLRTEDPPDDEEASFISGLGDQSRVLDETDSVGMANLGLFPGTPEFGRVKAAMERLQTKMSKARELIREEQTLRDENVNEYLRLAAQADKQQQARLKAVFEKKNTKSAQQMAHLQRKLESYQKSLRQLEAQGTAGLQGHRAPRQMLRDVGMGIKTVMSKPKEIAHLIRNKFGSADNINAIGRNGDNVEKAASEETYHPAAGSGLSAGNSNSLPGHGSQAASAGAAVVSGGSALIHPVTHGASQGSGGGKYTSEEGSECGSSVTSESMRGGSHISPRHTGTVAGLGLGLGLETIFQELQERREEVDRLREDMEQMKQQFQQDFGFLSSALQEERFRVERLEEQVNDLTELHQNEVENLKQNIADMEEKVQYQSEERLRDIHEALDTCLTRISKVEHQAQHQQHVSLEGIENTNARAVLVKLINMGLTVLQLLLVVVSTAAGILAPFLKTRVRIITTSLFALLLAFVLKQWPDLMDLASHVIHRYKQPLPQPPT